MKNEAKAAFRARGHLVRQDGQPFVRDDETGRLYRLISCSGVWLDTQTMLEHDGAGRWASDRFQVRTDMDPVTA